MKSEQGEELNSPVDGHDDGHGLAGQPHRLEHHDQGDQARVWDPCCSDARCCRRDRDDYHLGEVKMR